MNKRTLIISIILLSIFCSLTVWQMSSTFAQVVLEQKPKQPPRPPRQPKPSHPPAAPDNEDAQDSEPLKASMKLDRGGKVTISNRFGVITVKGYDGDTVEASALNESGQGFANKIALIKGDALRLRISVDGLPGRRHGRGTDYQIKVPRYAAVEIVDSQETEVEVGDIDGAVSFFASIEADKYRQTYSAIGIGDLKKTISEIPPIRPISIERDQAEYYFKQPVDGVELTFPIKFVKENGKWKIMEY